MNRMGLFWLKIWTVGELLWTQWVSVSHVHGRTWVEGRLLLDNN